MIKTHEKLAKSDILRIFTSGIKSECKIGMEIERLPINKKNFYAAGYDEGICDSLRQFAKEENWDYITDDYNIIGLKQNHDTITLEPGCQIEMSVEPQKNIFDLQKKINILTQSLENILGKYDIQLLQYGVSPLSTHQNINILPKRRYKIMAKYLWGILSDVMMRETAGIQCCVDFKSEEDAARKFKLANKLTPFMTAMFANSPIRGGVETGYKSFRALSWLNTDNDRCGFALNLDEDFSFEKYIDAVLSSPIIFLNKNDNCINVDGKINFEDYINSGYLDFNADIEDFKLHSNLYFPEVRLRNFIEIRNHDCTSMPYSVLAIYKGLLYSDSAMCELEELFKPYSHNDFAELRYDVPKNALQTPFKSYYVSDIAKEILNIAEKSLTEMKTGEEKYLEPTKELTFNNLCPADIILRNWNGLWNKDVSKLVKYLS